MDFRDLVDDFTMVGVNFEFCDCEILRTLVLEFFCRMKHMKTNRYTLWSILVHSLSTSLTKARGLWPWSHNGKETFHNLCYLWASSRGASEWSVEEWCAEGWYCADDKSIGCFRIDIEWNRGHHSEHLVFLIDLFLLVSFSLEISHLF